MPFHNFCNILWLRIRSEKALLVNQRRDQTKFSWKVYEPSRVSANMIHQGLLTPVCAPSDEDVQRCFTQKFGVHKVLAQIQFRWYLKDGSIFPLIILVLIILTVLTLVFGSNSTDTVFPLSATISE